jgi:hypothetical protein
MAQPSILITNLLDTTKELFYYHRKKVGQLQHRDYPFKCCTDLLQKLFTVDEAILDKLETINRQINNVRTADEEKTFVQESIDRLQRYGQLLGVLHSLLVYFELGSRDYIQEGTAVPVEKIIRKFDEQSAFILVPIFDYNYMYWDILRPLKKSLKNVLPSEEIERIFSSMRGKYAVFGLPLIMKNNIVLNAILSHELGHFLDETKGLSQKVLKKVVLDEERVDGLVRKMEKSRLGEKEVKLTYFITSGTLRARLIRIAATQVSDWITELVSDDIAFHLFGPIFLYSLSSFLITLVKLDEASSDHPPPRLRIQLLLEEFERMDYPKILVSAEDKTDRKDAEEFAKLSIELKSLIQNLKTEQPAEPDEIVMFQELVMDAVQKVVPEIRKEVRDLVTQVEYSPNKFKDDVFTLSKILGVIVPPSEIEVGKPASSVSILNAGALYKLLHASDLNEVFDAQSNMDKLEVRDRINALILKALELEDIQIQMSEALRGAKKNE